jgi:thioesterase domain-containing protein
MSNEKLPEVWLRGPIQGVPPLLQPVAHALLQAREEVNELMEDFPEVLLWMRPGNVASPGFHLQHLTGVLNRQLTYARGEQLTREQLNLLASEGKMEGRITTAELLEMFSKEVDDAITQLSRTEESSLTEVREVGRARIPSTVIGLLVHAAEHTTRHLGQLLVTVRVLKAQFGDEEV